MKRAIENYSIYLKEIKNAANNTVISYERDLRKMKDYMEKQGIRTVDRVTSTALNAYVLHLESSGMSSATISRTVAALRRFFDYQCKHGNCHPDPTELLKAPRVERKTTRVVTKDELGRLLNMKVVGPKQLRDRAMVLSMCQGIRASEVIGLTLEDMNLEMGYLVLRGERQSRTVAIGCYLEEALRSYLAHGRDTLLRERENNALFLNCNGGGLSRQGVWKVVKYYGERAGIPELTPDGLRQPQQA